MDKANERAGRAAELPPGTDQPGVRHTPGPWFATVHPAGEHHRQYALIRAVDSIAGMSNSGDYSAEEFEANARLIAAAPEMYEALRAFVACYLPPDGERRPTTGDVLSAAQRALAKAESRP